MKAHFLIVILLVFGCSQNQEIDEPTKPTRLPDKVLSINSFPLQNQFMQQRLTGLYSNLQNLRGDLPNLSDEVVVFEYINGFRSTIFLEEKSGNFYVEIFDMDNAVLLDWIYIDINIDENDILEVKKILSLTGNTIISNGRVSESTETWGKCMVGAIETLYNDWEDDAIGTIACWATGYWCAVGAGIACVF